MDIYDSLFSTSDMLNEQLANELFAIMPSDGPLVAIVDRQGTCWASDEEKFLQVFSDNQQLKQICTRVDDGGDPVITRIDEYGVVATELLVQQVNCGYAIILLPGYTCESVMENSDLIELVLNQIALIAGLIKKNNQLHHAKLKELSGIFKNSATSPN